MPQQVHMFVDNSNVWIEGKKVSGRRKTPPVLSNNKYRIDYGRLLQFVLDGRPLLVGDDIPKLYGSEPPPNDSIWKIIKLKGFDVEVFKRNIFNKEKGVDMKMGIDITKRVLKSAQPETIAIIAGDADFVPVVEEAQQTGWTVEVWYWSSVAGTLKSIANRFEELDSAVDKIGFEER